MKTSRNVHIEHFEDVFIQNGKEGIEELFIILNSLRNNLSSNGDDSLNVTTKWDGSLSVIFGVDPENSKFFVATKSLFNTEPKINYTVADIDRNHPAAEVNYKLKLCLRELPKLKVSGIFQCDFLYSSEDVNVLDIGGEKCITFKPNAVMYSIPYKSDISHKILKSKVGVAIHSQYHGKSIKDLNLAYNFNGSAFNTHSDVWVAPDKVKDLSGTISFTNQENAYLVDKMKEINEDVVIIGDNFLKSLDNYTCKKILKQYVAEKMNLGLNLSTYGVDNFKQFVDAKYTSNKIFQSIDLNLMQKYLSVVQKLCDIKTLISQKFDSIREIDCLVDDNGELKVTGGEGLVISSKRGHVVKLVDRVKFTRINFLKWENEKV